MTANINDNLANWSVTDASNQPDGTDTADIDAEFRRLQSVVRKYLATIGSDIASGSTVDLSTATGNSVTVTGTTTITSLGTVSAGMRFTLIFDGALTLTHNATSLILPGASDIITAAGDTGEFLSLGSGNWRCLSFTATDGVASYDAIYLPDGTGAVATTVQDKLRESVSVKDFGAVGDGVADDTAAIQAAIDAIEATGMGGVIFFPPGEYLVTTTLSVADNKKIILQGAGRDSVLVKGANGPVINLGKECSIVYLSISGEGASYTGAGVLIETGSLDKTSWRVIDHCYIFDTASYAVEFTGDMGGYSSQISHSRLVPRTDGVAAVKYPTLGSTENNGNRVLMDVWTDNQPIVDLADSNNSVIVGCQGGIPKFSANCLKANINGCRIVSYPGAATWTIDGAHHDIQGNAISLNAGTNSVTFAATLANTVFQCALNSTATFVDNSTGSTNGNDLYLPRVSYTPTWTSGGSTAIGDGTLNGSYRRVGDRCHVNIQMTIGSTTNVGSGAWYFSLPYTSAREHIGQAYVQNASPVAVYPGVTYIQGNATTVRATIAGFTSTYLGSSTPITWAAGDIVRLEFEYTIK